MHAAGSAVPCHLYACNILHHAATPSDGPLRRCVGASLLLRELLAHLRLTSSSVPFAVGCRRTAQQSGPLVVGWCGRGECTLAAEGCLGGVANNCSTQDWVQLHMTQGRPSALSARVLQALIKRHSCVGATSCDHVRRDIQPGATLTKYAQVYPSPLRIIQVQHVHNQYHATFPGSSLCI